MIHFIVHSAEGFIWKGGQAYDVYGANLQAAEGQIATIVTEDEFTVDCNSLYMNWNGTEYVPTERPKVPAYADGPAPLTLDMAHLPPGTTVRASIIYDETDEADTVETSDPADPVRLTTACTVTVTIIPPFPYFERTETLEVTDA